MTAGIKDALLALCSRVEALSSNATQDIFVLGDAKEAQLAYDILAAHGVDAKFYPDANGGKLYLARTPVGDKLLASVHAYAKGLRPLKPLLDGLSRDAAAGIADYSLGLTHDDQGNKITIKLQSPAAVQPKPFSPAPVLPVRNTAPVKKAALAHNEDELLKGPAITSSAEKGIYRYVSHKTAKNSMGLTVLAIITLVIITLGVLSKAVLCPDMATVKSNAWYCNLKRH